MANNIKGITVEIGGNTGPLDKALKDVNKTSRDLQGELREVNRQLKLDPTNTTLLTQRQRLLAESVANTRNKLETLKEAEQQAQVQFREGRISEEQYRALQREVIRTEQQLRGLESQAGRSNSKLNKISETTKKVGDAAGKIGDKMMPVTAAIAGAGTAASKFSIDFENSVAKASTIADEGEVSIGDLRKGILKLSDDTGVAATEIANNVYDAISAGQKTGDAVNFVSSSTKLAKAGFAEAGQSLDLLTTIMNSYGMKAEEVTKVSDILINTQNLGKVTVGELSSSMGKVIPTAKAYGINLQQVASGYAIMTAKGIKAAETTTYQASMFNELGKSGTKASDVVKKVSGKSFQDLIKSGKTVGDVLAMMNDYAKKNNLSLADLFGSAEAGKAALILSANAGKDFNEMLKSMNNTAGKTDEAFKKVSNTTGEKLKKSLNQFKNDAIKLGDSIAPIIQKISNLAGILAQKLSGLSKGQLDMIVKIGLIVAAIGPMAKLIQGITVIIGGVTSVIGTITGAIGLLTGSLTVATPAATALAGAITFITGPIGLTIIAVTALIAGFALLWKKCEGFRNFWIGLWNGIKQVTKTVVDAIVKFFTVSIPGAWNSTMNFLKGIPSWVSNLWTSIKVTTEKLWNGLKNFCLNIWKSIVAGTMVILTPFIKGITNLFSGMKQGLTVIFNGLKIFFKGIWNAIKLIFLGPVLLICDLVTGNFTRLKTDSIKLLTGLKNAFGQIWVGIKQIFVGSLQAIAGFCLVIWDGIVNTAKGIWNGLASFFTGLWHGIINIGVSAWSGFKNTIVNLITSIVHGVINIFNGLLNFFRSLPGTLYSCGVNMFSSMKNGISSTIGGVYSAIVSGFNSSIQFLTSLPSKAIEWGKDFIDGLVSGITGSIGKVVDAVKGVADKIRSFLHFSVPDEGPLTDYETWMPDFMEGLAAGIEDSKYIVKNAINKLSTDMSVIVNPRSSKLFKDSIKEEGNSKITNNSKGISVVNNFYQKAESPYETSKAIRKSLRDLLV